ncbi:unnamed protein product [Notodromas monacha]|uniref:MAM domain-containing protein n=1 Tax=Notodromas monacha TaxID=399045 RepID=A0A7R9GHD5_9CRUS|nr:unnamed protein product [Notodromas monacha]CAG0922671.1 unnamed protein product [Notodromas monacha]
MWGSSRPDAGFIAIDDVIFYDSKCEVLPSKAQVNAGDCSFDRDLCNYRRTEDGDRLGNWQLAIAGERLLRNMADHTYNNPAGGYAYFDIYDTNQRKIRLISPVIEPPRDEDDRACLAFWFHPLGSGDSTTLQLMQRIGDSNEVVENDEKMTPLWKVQTHQLDRSRDDWMFGQVEIDNSRTFRLIFEGIATKGGFAIDDIQIYTNQQKEGCNTRPAYAANPDRNGQVVESSNGNIRGQSAASTDPA